VRTEKAGVVVKLAKNPHLFRSLGPGALCAALSLTGITACGGGGSSPIAPVASGFTSFATATNTVCVTPSTVAQNVAIPPTGGVSGSISFGAYPADATGCDAVTIATGSDVATTQSFSRRASEAGSDAAGSAAVPLLTISVGAAFGGQQQFGSQTIVTGMQLNVGSNLHFPDGTYYATITPVPYGVSGPLTFTASHGILTVVSTGATFPFGLNANTVSVIALYARGVNPLATATPTASPSASPSASPTGTAAPSGSPTPTPHPSASGSATPTPGPSVTPTVGPTPTPTASHSPTPAPSATPAVYPLVAGASFNYLYSLQTATTTGSTIQLGTSYVGPVNAQLSGLGTYNGNPAYTLHTQGTTTNGNGTIDRLDYINVTSSGGRSEYVEYGYNLQLTYNKTNSVIEHDGTVLSYATPFINDMLPETSGASWAEPVAISETVNDYDTTSQNNPNILSGTLTRNADGSYSASGLSFNVPLQRLVRSNGTGYVIEGPASGPEQWAFALPQAGASGEVIPVTASYGGQTGTNLVPDWYPGGGQPASPLATYQSIDLGQVKAPSTCGTQSGTTSTHIQTVYSQLDPAAGFVESDVTDTYVVPGIGFVCKLDTDTVRNYDNDVTGNLTNTKVTTSSQVLTSYVL
jgi:hypothetical protein